MADSPKTPTRESPTRDPAHESHESHPSHQPDPSTPLTPRDHELFQAWFSHDTRLPELAGELNTSVLQLADWADQPHIRERLDKVERIAHQLLKEISEPSPSSGLRAEELAEELAAYLIVAHSNIPQRQERSHPIAPSKLKRAEEFILSNLNDEMSLSDIADAAGMSLFHFAKAFKQATGQSPHQYLTSRRMLRAREVMRLVGLCRSSIYVLEARGQFPARLKLGRRAVRWDSHDIERWLQSRSTAPR